MASGQFHDLLVKSGVATAFRVLLFCLLRYLTPAFPQPRFRFIRTKSITKIMGNKKDLCCQRVLGSVTRASSVCSGTGFCYPSWVELKYFGELLGGEEREACPVLMRHPQPSPGLLRPVCSVSGCFRRWLV